VRDLRAPSAYTADQLKGDEDRVAPRASREHRQLQASVPHAHRSFWMWLDGGSLAVLFAGKRLIDTRDSPRAFPVINHACAMACH